MNTHSHQQSAISNQHNFTVEIILPIRTRPEYNIFQRLKMRKYYNLPSNMTFVVINDGSNQQDSETLEKLCQDLGFKYHYIPTQSKLFNAARARNMGIKNSTADFLIFEDVDLISHTDFYHWINQQIQSLLINQNYVFFNIPVAYLKEISATAIQSPLSEQQYDELVTEIYQAHDSEWVEYHAPASSFLVVAREQAIIHGGYDEAFEGWGFEDSDFWLKLLKNSKLTKPRDFYHLDTRPYQDQVQWRGWRSLYRLYADLVAYKGIYSFHIWHPIAEHRNPTIRQKNHLIFKNNTHRYSTEETAFVPLWNENKPSHLFLNKNPHSFNVALFKIFNNPLLIEENNIVISEIATLIQKYNIESVVFNNVYANTKRRLIRDTFRELGIPCYVVERGALPNSIYIDDGGFCAESQSYQEQNWQPELSQQDYDATLEYIQNLKMSGASLEPQGNLIGGQNLKRKLFGDSKNIKILFVALQSPSDTTTNFFCGQVGSYQNFIEEIQRACYLLDDTEWKVIYKNHPLTIDKVHFQNAINVDEHHIGDILDACDAVTLINSGVGVLSVAYQKPVYYFGQAFYAISQLNQAVTTGEELSHHLLHNLLQVNETKAIRFISYLIHDFYSFATWERKERKHTDKAKMSISKNIEYDMIRIVSKKIELAFNHQSPINLQQSMLFDRYRLDEYIGRKDVTPTTKTVNDTTVTPTTKTVNDTTVKPKTKPIVTSPIKRKVNKLLNNPKLFFTDMIRNKLK